MTLPTSKSNRMLDCWHILLKTLLLIPSAPVIYGFLPVTLNNFEKLHFSCPNCTTLITLSPNKSRNHFVLFDTFLQRWYDSKFLPPKTFSANAKNTLYRPQHVRNMAMHINTYTQGQDSSALHVRHIVHILCITPDWYHTTNCHHVYKSAIDKLALLKINVVLKLHFHDNHNWSTNINEERRSWEGSMDRKDWKFSDVSHRIRILLRNVWRQNGHVSNRNASLSFNLAILKLMSCFHEGQTSTKTRDY